MSIESFKHSTAKALKAVSGTAGEALENHAYAKMVTRYGKEAAEKIIDAELSKANETRQTFEIYCRVKRKVQNDEISFLRAEAEATALARQVIYDDDSSGT